MRAAGLNIVIPVFRRAVLYAGQEPSLHIQAALAEFIQEGRAFGKLALSVAEWIKKHLAKKPVSLTGASLGQVSGVGSG